MRHLLLLLAALAAMASAHAASGLTPDQALKFEAGTAKMRAALSRTPGVRELVQGEFELAAVDLNDDGLAEIVVVARGPGDCTSSGCQVAVLEKQGPGRIVAILTRGMIVERLAVSKEKVNGYRALVVLNDKGGIAVDDRFGNPAFGRQIVYAMTGGTPKAAPDAAAAAPMADRDSARWVAEATGGKLRALKGKYYDKDCNASTEYEAEVVDLNGDGQPEVFSKRYGACFGRAGVAVDLLIKGKDGRWKSQFGFPGEYRVLKTKNLGYPDIEITGPGTCFPVWRWNGASYDLHKKCAR